MRQPPSMSEDINAPDRMRKIHEYLDGKTTKEQLDQTVNKLGVMEAVAWIFGGVYLEVEISAAGTAVTHGMTRTPEGILWYEGVTTPGNWLRRSTGGGDADLWTGDTAYLTSQVTGDYRFILV